MSKPPKRNDYSKKTPAKGKTVPKTRKPGTGRGGAKAKDKPDARSAAPAKSAGRSGARTQSSRPAERFEPRVAERSYERPREDRPVRRAAPDAPKKREKTGLKADLFGTHAVREAWNNPKRYVHALYITQTALEEFAPFMTTDAKRPEPTIVTKDELDNAFPNGTVHQGIALSAMPLAEIGVLDIIIKADKEKSVIVILDQVTDPHNIGAILRSACAFGADGVVMQTKHAPEMTGILAKTACGAADHIPVAYETNLSRALETLKEHHYTVIGLDEHAEKTFGTLPKYDRAVIVLGAEGSGMRRLIKEHCDVLVTLPTQKPINSLNVSNAAAVALYALLA